MLPIYPFGVKEFRLRQLFEQWYKIFNGNIRFLNSTTNAATYTKENIDGWPVQVTTPGVANTEFAVTHGLGRTPNGYIILWKNIAGDFYQGPATGTAWTTTQLYLKCNTATVTALIFVI